MEEQQSAPCRLPKEDSGVSFGQSSSGWTALLKARLKPDVAVPLRKEKKDSDGLGFLEISSKSRAPVLRAVLW